MEEWNWVLIFAIIATFAAMVSAKYAHTQYKFSERMSKKQLLLELFKDYRSEKMLNALNTIHGFIKKCKEQEKNYIDVYMKEFNDDPSNDIHCQRRVLEKFYHHLAWLHDKGYIENDMIFDNWNTRDLEIVNKIIPIEKELLKKIYGITDTENDTRILKKLYEDAGDYDEKVRKKINKQ